jgi:glucokinase
MKKYVIGIDIGGTKIATGLVTEEGKLFQKVVLPTLSKKGIDVSLGQVYRSVEEVMKIGGVSRNSITGIGACAPGPLDPLKGIVHNPPNLQGWKEVPLAGLLRKKFKVKTRVENDANAAGMAEVIWGAAKGYKHVFYVTVSTGIGTAIIINGKIYHGKNGMAGEGGHVTINFDDKKARCNCGNTGCIEAMASGPYTVRRLVEKLKKNPKIKTNILDMVDGVIDDISMVTIGDAASEGDSLAIDTIEEQGRLIGIWLGSMINLLDPEIVVIGGGVSLIGKVLFRPIRKGALDHTINVFAADTKIVQAKLKRDVGIYGAASVMFKKGLL